MFSGFGGDSFGGGGGGLDFGGIAKGISGVFSQIGGVFKAMQAQDAQEEYYEQIAAREARLRENTLILTKAANEMQLKFAEVKKDTYYRNANIDYANAFNAQNALVQDLNKANRLVSFKVGEATQAYATSGVAHSGSAAMVVDSLKNTMFGEVQNNLRQSMNGISAMLNQRLEKQFAGDMEVYTAKEVGKMRLARVEAGLDGG